MRSTTSLVLATAWTATSPSGRTVPRSLDRYCRTMGHCARPPDLSRPDDRGDGHRPIYKVGVAARSHTRTPS